MTGDLARTEDPALLCGQGQFLDDLGPLPGPLAAAMVRSPHPHARIAGLDASAALASPGMTAVPRWMAAHCSADMAPVPESVSRSIGTSSAAGSNRLYPAATSPSFRAKSILSW